MFKYLEDANSGMNAKSAAQAYIDKSQSKNKYASVSDPSNPYSMGEGVKPTGGLYDDQRFVTNQTEIDAAKAKNSADSGGGGDYSHMTGDSDTERNYRQGNWGKGNLDAEALAEKYGLDRSQEGQGEGHIWGTNSDGSKVYIGKSSMDLASNKDLIVNHSKQANSDEKNHSDLDEELSSSGDIKGAILTEWKGGGGQQNIPEPEYGIKPIEHSPEIKQAKERVQNWESSVEDGSMSDGIFNNNSIDSFDPNDTSVPQVSYGQGQAVAEDKYNFDATKGSDGIGAQQMSTGAKGSTDAAAAFVDSQLSSVKKKFNFQPSS